MFSKRCFFLPLVCLPLLAISSETKAQEFSPNRNYAPFYQDRAFDAPPRPLYRSDKVFNRSTAIIPDSDFDGTPQNHWKDEFVRPEEDIFEKRSYYRDAHQFDRSTGVSPHSEFKGTPQNFDEDRFIANRAPAPTPAKNLAEQEKEILRAQITELQKRLEAIDAKEGSNKFVNPDEVPLSMRGKTPIVIETPPEPEPIAAPAIDKSVEIVEVKDPEQERAIKAEYNSAFSALSVKDYDKSIELFTKFLDVYPNHRLSANAYYWLAESFYGNKDYTQSSVYFMRGYEYFPKSSKASDSLLRLAMSLGNLGEHTGACATFAKLQKEYPDISVSIKRLIDRELERYKCTG